MASLTDLYSSLQG